MDKIYEFSVLSITVLKPILKQTTHLGFQHGCGKATGCIGNDVRFDASTGLPCSWNFGESHMTIYIQGFIIDVVDGHSRSFNSSDFVASPDVRPVDMLDTWPVEDALEFKSRITISLDEKLCEIGCLITELSTFPTGEADHLRETTALSLYMKERTTNGLKKDKMGLQRMMDSRGDTRLMHELIVRIVLKIGSCSQRRAVSLALAHQ